MISEDDENDRLIEGSETEGEKKKGMVLPFEPHSITFDNVVYSVDMPQVTFQNFSRIIFVSLKVFIFYEQLT